MTSLFKEKSGEENKSDDVRIIFIFEFVSFMLSPEKPEFFKHDVFHNTSHIWTGSKTCLINVFQDNSNRSYTS